MPSDIESPGPTPPDPLQAALLRLAICCGDGEAVRRCLDEGADPNARDATGASPLMLATSLGHAQLCALLLDHGAEPAPPGHAAAETAPPADVAAAREIEPVTEPAPAPDAGNFSDRAYHVAKALLAAKAQARHDRASAA